MCSRHFRTFVEKYVKILQRMSVWNVNCMHFCGVCVSKSAKALTMTTVTHDNEESVMVSAIYNEKFDHPQPHHPHTPTPPHHPILLTIAIDAIRQLDGKFAFFRIRDTFILQSCGVIMPGSKSNPTPLQHRKNVFP